MISMNFDRRDGENTEILQKSATPIVSITDDDQHTTSVGELQSYVASCKTLPTPCPLSCGF